VKRRDSRVTLDLSRATGALGSLAAADNGCMGELMRLAVAAVASLAGAGCVLAARTASPRDVTAGGAPVRRAFAYAAVLAAAGLPALVLDSAGLLSPLAGAGVLALLAAALIAALGGRVLCWRASIAATGRRWCQPTGADLVAVIPTQLRGPLVDGAPGRRRLTATVLVAVTDDGYGVELNQN
jgi:hypothetical protein